MARVSARCLALVLAAGLAPAAFGQTVRFEFIPNPTVFNEFAMEDQIVGLGGNDISSDGSVIVGTSGAGLSWRWTRETGLTFLNENVSAQGPHSVSDDGTKVSGTIMSLDHPFTTEATNEFSRAAIWDLATGEWTLVGEMPGGQHCDAFYMDAYELSGDGNALCGLSWIDVDETDPPTNTGCDARAFKWDASGTVDLGSVDGGSTRASAINSDGTVMCGFSHDPIYGNRRAAAWVNGVEVLLDPQGSEAFGVNSDGTIVCGYSPVLPGGATNRAVLWHRQADESWTQQDLGIAPLIATRAIATDVSDDGGVVVGFGGFFAQGPSLGWFYTPELGIKDIKVFLAENGIDLGPFFFMSGMTAVSDDGRYLIGNGLDSNGGFLAKTFRVELVPAEGGCELCTAGLEADCTIATETDCLAAGGVYLGEGTDCTGAAVCCPCDWDGNITVNSDDFFSFLNDFFAGDGDFDASGTTNSDDFFAFLNCFFDLASTPGC